MEREIGGRAVRGVDIDPETRCAHYDTDRDVVALRFACCDAYYPCFRCHGALADHDAERLSVDESGPAVLCGVCAASFPPRAFVEGDHACPECEAAFNPGCENHYDRYFAFEA